MQRIGRKVWTTAALATAVALGGVGVAYADNVNDDVVVGGNDTFVAGGSTTISYTIVNNNAGGAAYNACDAADGSPVKVTPNLAAGVTANPASLTFSSCGTAQSITYRATTAGDYPLSVTTEDTRGNYNVGNAVATLHVTAPPPPPNTAPSVSVTGVTNGSSYPEGAVPAAGCSVVDAQDGPSTFSAALSGITGADATGGVGSQTATCTATDSGGLRSTPVTATYTITDATAPTISSATDPSGPDGDNGWFTGDVSLTWTVTEPDSASTLVTTGCLDQTVTADQAATAYSCSALSAGGSAPQQTASIRRDAAAPTISAVATTPAGPYTAGTFSNVPVTVTFTCGDPLSGVASCPPPVVIDSDTAGTPVSGTATDNAGNEASSAPIDVRFDGTGPTITSSASTPSGPYISGTFTDETVTVVFSCDDDGQSGVQSCPSAVVIGSDTDVDGDPVVRTATDNAGNSTDSTPIVVKVDKTRPTIAASASVPDGPYSGGFTHHDVTVAFDCADLLSGLATCSPSTVISVDTPLAGTDVSGTATDNAGNSETSNPLNVKVDKTAPTITASASTPAGPYTGAPTNQPVTVAFTCADTLSGVLTCPTAYVVGADTPVGGVVVSGVGSDNAGNVATSNAITITVDRTVPTVSLVGGPAAASYFSNVVPAAPTCTANDALSGLAGPCSVTGYSTAVGTHTLSATATDRAGNTATATRIYTVRPNLTFGGFFQPVDDNGVLNLVKGGSTVPLKFMVSDQGVNQTSTTVVRSFTQAPVSCSAGGEDQVEELATAGGTALRYDATAGQFIQNWKSPTGAGTCYRATVTTIDGVAHSALFKLK